MIGGDEGETIGGRSPDRRATLLVDSDELTALYRAADVMVVTSLSDGMNLVAKNTSQAASTTEEH